MLTKTNFGSYIRAGQNKLFIDSYQETPHQFASIFKQEDITTKNMVVTLNKSFGAWAANTEGNPISKDSGTFGSIMTTTIIPARYDKGYEVSYELLQDDEQGVFSGEAGIGGSAKLLGKSLYATIETLAANALSGSNIIMPTEPFFSDTHRPGNDNTSLSADLGNLLSEALDEEGVKECAKNVRGHIDTSGSLPVGAIPKYLIVHPNDEFTARSILNPVTLTNLGLTTSTPNLELVVLDYLPDDDAFYIKAGNTDNFYFVWRERPTFGSQQVSGSLDWLFYGYTRMAAKGVNWRGVAKSVKPSA